MLIEARRERSDGLGRSGSPPFDGHVFYEEKCATIEQIPG